MRRKVKGSFTVEAAFLIPFLLFLFGMLIQVLFYYHDKNVLMAKSMEAAVYGSGRQSPNETEVQEYFRTAISGKLLLFTEVEQNVEIEEKQVTVNCNARKNKMTVAAKGVAFITSPEQFIREMRKIQKIGDEVGEHRENIHQE